MAEEASARRRRAGRLRLDRRDPRPGADRRRAQCARPRARRLARHARPISPSPSPRTSCATTGATRCSRTPAHETLTFRNNSNQMALPMRQLGSFLPGTGVGGAGIHWNGQTWRFLPVRLRRAQPQPAALRRGGHRRDDMTIQDWGVTYDELEPHYDKFEYLCGISGKAGNLNGQIQEGGNPFEGAAVARVSQSADGHDLRPDAVRRGRERTRPPAVPAAGRRTCRAPTPTRSACSSGPAPIAASARNSAAATIPRRARRPPSCRC